MFLQFAIFIFYTVGCFGLNSTEDLLTAYKDSNLEIFKNNSAVEIASEIVEKMRELMVKTKDQRDFVNDVLAAIDKRIGNFIKVKK